MRYSFSQLGILMRIGCVLLLLCIAIVDTKLTFARPNRAFDEYGIICWKEEKARLDNFAIRLFESGHIGNIIVYDGRRACRGEAIARAIRAKKYLVEFRKVPANQIMWRFGGYQNEMGVTLMDVPRGYPEYPADHITISPKDVVFVGNCRARVRPMRCPT
jgi:hypothetical protein